MIDLQPQTSRRGDPSSLASDAPTGVVIPIRATASARRNEIGGEHDGMLKVSVTQAPEKGKANKAIIALLAKRLNCAKSDCKVVLGETSSRKKILVRGLTLDTVRQALSPGDKR